MTVGQLVAWLELKEKGFVSGLAKAKAQLAGLKKDLDSSSRNTKALGDALESVGKPAILSSLAGSAVSLAGALEPAAGAAWLLPAPLAMITAAGLTAKAGMIGMGDAMKAIAKGDAKALAKALQDMSPAGKAFVTVLDGLNKKLTDVRKNVQQQLFAGLDTELSNLGNTYLPLADKGMGLVATSLNGMAKAATTAMNTPFMQGVAAQVFATTASSVSAFTPAVGALITALGQIIKVGLPFLAQFSQWAGKALAAKAAFLGTAQGAQYLHDKIAAGLAVLQQLGRISGNILTGLQNAMNAGATSGQSLLNTLEQLTAKFAAWSSTAQGQAQLNDLLTSLVSIAKSLAVLLPPMAGALTTLASAFSSLPAPVQAALGAFLGWSLILGRIVKVFAPLFGLLGRIAPAVVTAAGKWGLLGAAAKTAATSTEGSVTSILGAVGRSLVSGLATLAPRIIPFILEAIAAVGRFVPGIGWVVAGVATVVALIITHWQTVKTATVTAWNAVVAFVQSIPARIGAILSGLGAIIATAATAAWNWLTTAAQTAVTSVVGFITGLPGQIAYGLGFLAGMVYLAATTAWNWLWQTIPIAIAAVGTWLASLPGVVGGFLAGLASTVASAATAAWQWLVTTATDFGNQALAFIQALPGQVGSFLASLPGIVSSAASTAWNAFLSTTQSVAQSALSFIQTIPGKIQGFFSGAASWLVASGRAIIEGLWNGLKSAAGAVLSWISDLAGKIKAGFNAAIHVNSPSKDFIKSGLSIGEGLIVGLKRIGPKVLSRVNGLGTDVTSMASKIGLPAMGMPNTAGARGAGGLVGDALDLARQTVININNPKAERASDTLNREARTLAALGVFG